MRKVCVTGFCASLGSGELGLSPEQAGPRLNAGTITPGEGHGVFNIVGIVTFKRGEIFGYAGDIVPSLLSELTPMSSEDGEGSPMSSEDGEGSPMSSEDGEGSPIQLQIPKTPRKRLLE